MQHFTPSLTKQDGSISGTADIVWFLLRIGEKTSLRDPIEAIFPAALQLPRY
jgi:hypothetical protein